MTRVLGYIRLSRLTDETTSPGRQREVIERWAAAQGHELIDIVSDLDVSGAKSPFERPELGPRLANPAQFDILACAKMDRLSRSAGDVHELLKWATKHQKTMVAISDSIDTSTQAGRIFVQLAAIFAEVERSNIQERVTGSRVTMRTQGRWPAGQPPYGFTLAQKDFDGSLGYTLEEDPESASHLRWIIDQVLSGQSFVQIAKDLNARGVLTPKNYGRAPEKRTESEWAPQTITKMLRNVALRGHSTHRPKLPDGSRGEPEVIHEHGEPVEFGPALIDSKTWKKLQAELDSRETPTQRRRDTASLLLGFAYCGECGSRLHLSWGGAGKYRRRTYRCVNYRDGKCPVGPMYADNLEQFVTSEVLAVTGKWEIPEINMIPGEDRTEELETAEESLKLLMADRERGMYRTKTTSRIFDEKVAEYEAVIEKLESEPVIPARVEYRPSGKTVASILNDGSHAEKRELLDRLPYYCTVNQSAYRGSRDWWGRCRLWWSDEKVAETLAEANDAEDRGADDEGSLAAIRYANLLRRGIAGDEELTTWNE